MTIATSKALDEGQIRKLMDDRVKAVRTKDVDASMANLSPDILSFDGTIRRRGWGILFGRHKWNTTPTRSIPLSRF